MHLLSMRHHRFSKINSRVFDKIKFSDAQYVRCNVREHLGFESAAATGVHQPELGVLRRLNKAIFLRPRIACLPNW